MFEILMCANVYYNMQAIDYRVVQLTQGLTNIEKAINEILFESIDKTHSTFACYCCFFIYFFFTPISSFSIQNGICEISLQGQINCCDLNVITRIKQIRCLVEYNMLLHVEQMYIQLKIAILSISSVCLPFTLYT